MNQPAPVNPDLYNRDYYLKSLPGLEHADNPEVIDEAAETVIRIGGIKPGQRVLDFGCGRGTCLIKLALYGCSGVGIDFSPHAVVFACEYLKRFPEEIRKRLAFSQSDTSHLDFEREFDVIVFNQVYEHLHDWELEQLMGQFKRALKPGGTLVISTPNLDYIRYLFPIKRVLNLPGKIIKESVRVLRGKSRHAGSVGKFLREVFKIRYPESEHTRLHINLGTPRSIARFMERQGFDVQVECVDRHRDFATLLTRSFWGETIWVAATRPRPD